MSDWLAWQKARWEGKQVPDYFVGHDGAFYCDHGCKTLDEHQAKAAAEEVKAA